MCAGDPVQEQQPVDVVQLVLERPGLEEPRVDQDERAVRRTSLRVRADVHGEHPPTDAHLVGREPDTAGRDTLSGEEVSRERNDVRAQRVDIDAWRGQADSRSVHDSKDPPLGQVGQQVHRTSVSAGRTDTPTPSSWATSVRARESESTSALSGKSTSATSTYRPPARRVVRSVMLPPYDATARVIEETMPARSAPCTVRTYGIPPSGTSPASGSGRTYTVRSWSNGSSRD